MTQVEAFIINSLRLLLEANNHPMFEDGIQLVDMVYLKRER